MLVWCCLMVLVAGQVGAKPNPNPNPSSGLDQICSHDGKQFRSGTSFDIGCGDQCKCEDGVIYCPPEDELKCPRSCLFKASRFNSGSTINKDCHVCQCILGTVYCSKSTCERTCSWGGLKKNDGEKWKNDCNTCKCEKGKVTCTDETCFCTDGEGDDKKIYDNGVKFRKGCNMCTCINGQLSCGSISCDKPCQLNNELIESGDTRELFGGCVIATCNDGSTDMAIAEGKPGCFK